MELLVFGKAAWRLVRVHFFLVLPLILDQVRVIFTVMRILFFVNRVHPASVDLAVAVLMVYLGSTVLNETFGVFRDTIGDPQTHVDGIH